MSFALEVSDLTKTYKTGVKALQGVSFKVEAGEFFGMLGPNGAGKTTILNTVTSLVLKNSGSIKVFGIDIDSNFAAAKRKIGLVPQEFNFMGFDKVIDTVLNQAGYYGVSRKVSKARAEPILKRLDLWSKRDAQSRFLSGGMKRRLMIARALLHEPELLILDEPSAGVDIELRRSMWTYLREINAQGTTIILTSHYLEEIEQLCKRIAIINSGKILAETTTQDLISKLPTETFIFDLEHKIDQLPECDNFTIKLLDNGSLEVSLSRGQDLNIVFGWLTDNGIKVSSMRNSANRLEESFLQIVKGDSE